MLQSLELSGIQHVPSVLSRGTDIAVGQDYMVIKPYGRLLAGYDDPVIIAQTVLDAAVAIRGAAKLGVLHRDISFGNLVTHEGRCESSEIINGSASISVDQGCNGCKDDCSKQ